MTVEDHQSKSILADKEINHDPLLIRGPDVMTLLELQK